MSTTDLRELQARVLATPALLAELAAITDTDKFVARMLELGASEPELRDWLRAGQRRFLERWL